MNAEMIERQEARKQLTALLIPNRKAVLELLPFYGEGAKQASEAGLDLLAKARTFQADYLDQLLSDQFEYSSDREEFIAELGDSTMTLARGCMDSARQMKVKLPYRDSFVLWNRLLFFSLTLMKRDIDAEVPVISIDEIQQQIELQYELRTHEEIEQYIAAQGFKDLRPGDVTRSWTTKVAKFHK